MAKNRSLPSHTQGEWINDSMLFSAGWRCIVNLPGDRCIDIADPRNRPTDEEDYANAQLIATAPKLLAACRETLRQLEEYQQFRMDYIGGPIPPRAPVDCERILREVITEATSPKPGSSVWAVDYRDSD